MRHRLEARLGNKVGDDPQRPAHRRGVTVGVNIDPTVLEDEPTARPDPGWVDRVFPGVAVAVFQEQDHRSGAIAQERDRAAP
ncbi:MAG: hypothetical protein WAV00_07125 [Nocardioides sp.]